MQTLRIILQFGSLFKVFNKISMCKKHLHKGPMLIGNSVQQPARVSSSDSCTCLDICFHCPAHFYMHSLQTI